MKRMFYGVWSVVGFLLILLLIVTIFVMVQFNLILVDAQAFLQTVDAGQVSDIIKGVLK